MSKTHTSEFSAAMESVGETVVILEIATERNRQIKVEGWSASHDDDHVGGELAAAAICYASTGIKSIRRTDGYWPFDLSWWKPGKVRRNLIKAAALIVAEIERIDRAG